MDRPRQAHRPGRGSQVRAADALGVVHSCGVVRRDIKPANIMRTDGGGIKRLDFGIAKFLDPSLRLVKTQPGCISGTTPPRACRPSSTRQPTTSTTAPTSTPWDVFSTRG
ncbi:hypothetical protein [Streptomyces sp. NPDC004435]|uniref:protein kinase domain-containing protein n=1 Tax=Streptomyces sp. NPDC004435 TaxID=3364701 RepID=UPI0036BCFC62